MITNFLIDEVAFSIGNFEVAWYGIIIGLGILLAIGIGIREAERFGIDEDTIITGAMFAVPLAILGARTYYVFFEDGLLGVLDIGHLLAIHDGGLAIHGGIIVGFIVALIYSKKKDIDIIRIFDIMAPSFLLAQSIGRYGNFVNQEAYGGPTTEEFLSETLSLPKFIVEQMNVYGTYHHPTFLYESLWNLTGFMIIMYIRRMRITYKGELFLGYIAWYGFGRFFIEAARTDSLMMHSINLKTNQVSSALMFLVGAGLIVFNRIRKVSTEYYVESMN